MNDEVEQNSERLVAGPSKVPGTTQVRQPIVAAGIGIFVLFFGLMLWFIASKLGALTQNQPQLAAGNAPGVISSAQPARPEDIGGEAQSNALPSPQAVAYEHAAVAPTLAPGDLAGTPVTPMPAQAMPAQGAAESQPPPAEPVAAPSTPSPRELAARAQERRREHAADEARAAAQSDLSVKLTGTDGTALAANGSAPSGGPPTQRGGARSSEPDDYIVPGASEYLLRRGMIIPATLYTSIDSTVGGTIIAYVNQNIYDSRHRSVVVPKGAKLTGSFGGITIQHGQARIPVAWDSIQLTDDSTIVLDNFPGVDLAGTSGLGAKVDNHTRRLFTNVVLLSLLSAGAQLAQPQRSNCGGFNGTGCYPTVGQQVSQAVGNSIAQAGTTIFTRDANIAPTLHTVEGSQVAVMVERDIPVRPWSAP